MLMIFIGLPLSPPLLGRLTASIGLIIILPSELIFWLIFVSIFTDPMSLAICPIYGLPRWLTIEEVDWPVPARIWLGFLCPICFYPLMEIPALSLWISEFSRDCLILWSKNDWFCPEGDLSKSWRPLPFWKLKLILSICSLFIEVST